MLSDNNEEFLSRADARRRLGLSAFEPYPTLSIEMDDGVLREDLDEKFKT